MSCAVTRTSSRPLQIKNIHMVRDRETDVFKGFCYVEFESVQDLEQALSANGADVEGRILRVDVAEDRRGPGGRGRGGPRGRSEGHSGRGQGEVGETQWPSGRSRVRSENLCEAGGGERPSGKSSYSVWMVALMNSMVGGVQI